jgi:hypothetical protein
MGQGTTAGRGVEVPSTSTGGVGPSWGALIAFGLATRMVVLILGILLANRGEGGASAEGTPADGRDGGPWSWVESWYRFDALWYLRVSEQGYSYEPGVQSTAAFMPLLPLVMSAGSAVGLDRRLVGLIVPNLAFVLGLACFGRIAARLVGDSTTAWRACLLLTVYPSAFFFSAPYQESLGLALTTAAVLAWMARRPVAAAATLAWASTSRLTVAAVSIALVAEWADFRLRGQPARASAWAVAAAGGIGVGAFFLYLGLRLGDPLVHLRAHEAWGRKTGLAGLAASSRQILDALWGVGGFLPATLLIAAFFAREAVVGRVGARRGWALLAGLLTASVVGWVVARRMTGLPSRPVDLGPLLRRVDLLVFLLIFGLGLRAWRLRGPFWACLILVPIFQGMATGTPLSMKRIVLSCFPAFIEAAELCPRRWGFVAVLAGCAVGQVASTDRFVHKLFAG